MKNKYQIVYIPRIEDEVVIAQYNRREEAKEHMNYIKVKSPINSSSSISKFFRPSLYKRGENR